jgi:superfamily I DNA and/or RNA helicase
MMMTFRNLPTEQSQYSPHIWNCFSLVVPVISTTFSSFSSLFRDLVREQIAYLLIDEAGQAAPHKALGAIWRSKKVIVVGDPLQIEPVELLPEELGAQIVRSHGLKTSYNPLSSSVQRFADYCNEIGTYITNSNSTTWVGSPLRVHRRCNNPMFNIANQISYDNLMIYRTKNKLSHLQNLFPKSLWIDIQDSYAVDKWVRQESEVSLEIVNKLIGDRQALPSLFIISPFKNVSRQTRYLFSKKVKIAGTMISSEIKDAWISDSIGTIHTFQGKEAEMVIIILGCDEKSQGAINWAASKANILNVALTRAKNTVIVIGNSKIWGRKNYFDVLYRNISLVSKNDFSKEYLQSRIHERIMEKVDG